MLKQTIDFDEVSDMAVMNFDFVPRLKDIEEKEKIIR